MFAQLDGSQIMGLLLGAFFLLDTIAVVLIVLAISKRKNAPPPEVLSSPKTKSSNKWGRYVLLTCCLVWSVITLGGDFTRLRDTEKQYQALNYPAVEGEVLSCAVKENADADGVFYDVDIEYAYRVQNQAYTSRRIRYVTVWDKGSVSEFVEKHPPKTRLSVYYNQDDPAEALLLPGLNGLELYLLLLLVPFNMVMLGLWGALFTYFHKGEKALTGLLYGTAVIEREEHVRIRLPELSPALGGLITLTFGPIPFVVCGGLCCGMPPPWAVMVLAWAIVLGSAALIYLKLSLTVASGKTDLIIDCLQKTLTLPQTFGRKKAVVVPLADVLEVQVVPVQDAEKAFSYVPTLHWRAGNEVKEAKLASWDDQQQAEQLADLIRTRVGLVALSG